ncbi:MAG: type II CRISPR RNA-guided endonuclease Cas9 [Paludibacter sp.]|jgi:CRISPR-associated endonuclease Csn1
MKKILGLDLGTNSIGWALINHNFKNQQGEILGLGSRILPSDPTILSRYSSGLPLSKAKAGQAFTPTGIRTDFRGTRRLGERDVLRRERLHRVLNIMGFLPQHYANEIDFEHRLGQFKKDKEPKIAYRKNSNGKFEFIFQKSFEEMVADFRETQPQLFYIKPNGEETKIPYDWTIYYLRKKALSQKIEKEELAWILLNFNQKRGYYQLRGEDDEKNNIKEYCALLKVVSVEKGEKDKKNDNKTWYKMTFENGWEYSATFLEEPNWLNTEREFLITEEYDDEGNIKIVKDRKSDTTGKEKRKITPLPSFQEIDAMSTEAQNKIYKKIKARTEITITNSGKTVGAYIYDTLLQQPNQKIRGKLIRTIERKFYKDELKQILKEQKKHHSELRDKNLYNSCINELYEYNEDHKNNISKKDITYLFIDDIIFYQRPLRSQKSTIGNCSLEYKEHKINKKDENGSPIKNVFEKDENGNDIIVKKYLKGIPKSNPYYQEFRVWQWLYNLKIYTREDDKDVTFEFIKDATDLEKLFEFLMTKNEVNNKDIIEYLIEEAHKNSIEKEQKELFSKLNDEKINTKVKSKLKDKVKELLPKYRWNYVFDNSKDKEEDKSKKYPCNPTGSEIRKRLENVINLPADFLTKEKEYQLWHIIYSVKDKNEFEKALAKFANKNSLDEISFVESFKSFKPFESEHGSFSEKAIKKLLPLMRLGRYWEESEIPQNVIERAKSIKERLADIESEKDIENVADDAIPKQVLKSFFKLKNSDIIDFIRGLQLDQASYLVYGRHSEAATSDKWTMSHDIQEFLYEFRQHSLRNPIVEQVVTETLRVVKDIWEQEAIRQNLQPTMVYDEHKKREVKSYPNVFDEIHIELGRNLKNTAEDRQAITNNISENETTNLRIKKMLLEFSKDDSFKNKEDFSDYCKDDEDPTFYKKGNNPIRPYSRSQFDILKIYEDDVLKQFSDQELKNEKFDDAGTNEAKNVFDISNKSEPTKAEILRYKLWLEQKYQSPYTGKIIPLSKLFTPAYEIDHIIPRSRYFDDSYSNRVICEAEVNLLKSNKLGLDFIKNHCGQIVQIGEKTVTIFNESEYTDFVLKHYKNNNKKRRNLLLDDIPDKMIDRQLNDTRYISKYVSGLLSNIVRKDTNDKGVNSVNLIPVTGAITSKLKQSWGLNDKWNELILPRFQRMNHLTNSEKFTTKNREGHTIPAIPLEYSKGFQMKRIDHRHHALDALVIACTTREHVQYLNNENAKSQKFHLQKGLAKQLREFECVEIKKMIKNKKGRWVKSDETETREIPKAYIKPWANFPTDAKNQLEKVIVSFKKNNRIINKTTNYYQKWQKQSDGSMKKVLVKQEKGDSWAIRKPLHEELPYGKVDLKWHTPKRRTYSLAIRKTLDTSFNTDKIEKITDLGIQKILTKHLSNEKYQNRFDEKGQSIPPEKLAFSPEGIEEMNKNIQSLNDGKKHQPIYKVRVYEDGTKFQLSENPNSAKSKKYMGTAAGTNTFSIYRVKGEDKRLFETVPLNEVIAYQKLNSFEKKNSLVLPKNTLILDGEEIEVEFLFDLSPGEIVYVPFENETRQNVDFNNLTKEQIERLYKYEKASGNQAYFVRCDIASLIKSYDPKSKTGELGSQNKLETTMCDDRVKIIDKCWKVEIDRLGNIVKVIS